MESGGAVRTVFNYFLNVMADIGKLGNVEAVQAVSDSTKLYIVL